MTVVVALMGMMTAAPLHAAPPPLSICGNLPGVERVAMSPSGDRVAIIGVVEGARRLVVMDRDRKALRALPLADDKIRGLYWAGDDRVLVYKSDTVKLDAGFITNKTELFTMVVIPLKGEKPWSVFASEPRIKGGVRGFYGIQQRAGLYYGYFAGITYGGDFRSPDLYLTGTAPTLYEVDLQNQQIKVLAPPLEGASRDWVVGPGGNIGATLDYMSRSGRWVVRNGAGQKIADGINPLGRVGLVGLGATPQTVILSERLKNAGARWYEIPLAGGERREILVDVPVDNAYFDDRPGSSLAIVRKVIFRLTALSMDFDRRSSMRR